MGEEGFEEERGGDLVNLVEAGEAAGCVAAGGTGLVEEGVGFARGEAFIEEMVREGGVFGEESGGEGVGLCRLRARGAVGVEGIAEEEGADFVFADETGDGFKVGTEVGAMEGEEGLRGEAETVGDGEADASVADIEREDAGESHEGSVRVVQEQRVGL